MRVKKRGRLSESESDDGDELKDNSESLPVVLVNAIVLRLLLFSGGAFWVLCLFG